MKPATDASDAARDKPLRTGLRARRGAGRLAEDRQDKGRAATAARPRRRSRDEDSRNPALGFVVAATLSGLLWTAIVAAVRALWG